MLTAAVADNVDRGATPSTRPKGDALNDFRYVRLFAGRHRMAVESAGPWPGPLGPEDEPIFERQPQQVRQRA